MSFLPNRLAERAAASVLEGGLPQIKAAAFGAFTPELRQFRMRADPQIVPPS
jgi:hypothetical protein